MQTAIDLARALLARMIARRRQTSNAFGVSGDDVMAVLAHAPWPRSQPTTKP